MSLSAPRVYIGDTLMDNYALADMPVLAGLSFNWGTDSQVDFPDAATLSAQLLITTPSNLDFLVVGTPFAVLDSSGATLFAGRIATLKATPDKRRRDALLVSLTAVDTLADLTQYRMQHVDWTTPSGTGNSTTAATRRAQLRAALPAGWALDGSTSYDWTTAREQRWTGTAWLPLLDMHLRSVIGRRHNTSRYVPGTGLLPRLTIANERAKTAPTETLSIRSDNTWYMSTAAPANSFFAAIPGRAVARDDLEWEKNPDDTITDVQLSSVGINYGIDSETGVKNTDDSSADYDIWVNSYPNVNNGPIKAKYGHHQITFEVDTLGGGLQSPHVGYIVNYWVDADTQWRPTSVTIPDSRRLTDAQVLGLLDVTKRYNAYVTVDSLPVNNPGGGSRVRSYVLAGEAAWTGKKWTLTLTLGRVPGPAATAGNLTFTSIATHPTQAINAGTAETVGTELSFADFAYIGA